MDDPGCDPLLLANTYGQFARVNALFTGWGRVFRRYVAPCLTPGATVLDVGCGAGDLARRIRRWSERAGTPTRVVAIDPDLRAIRFARDAGAAPGIEFRQASAEDLLADGERFDVVVSNHLLHHLDDGAFAPFLETTAALARRAVVHSDMSRHGLAYAAFSLTRPLFPRSLIVEDGLTSIRRAFTPGELRGRAPSGWEVRSMAPFRNVLLFGGSRAGS